jgi:hypothetical protein
MPDLAGRAPADPDRDATAIRSRRRFARRQWRRRWLSWRPVLAVVLLVGLLVGAGWLVFFSRYLAVQDVEVTGTGLLAAQDVRHAARVPEGEPLARVDLGSVERRVEALAAVRDAAVADGWTEVWCGDGGGVTRFSYLERADSPATIVELMELNDATRAMGESIRAACAAWRPGDPTTY